jgi:hypothetical protein
MRILVTLNSVNVSTATINRAQLKITDIYLKYFSDANKLVQLCTVTKI